MEKIIINVGRQVGSSGSEIAQLLAKEFNARLLDKELLDLAAEESGFSAKLFKKNDEHRGFLNHLFHFRGAVTSGNFYEDKISPEALFKFQSDAIRKAASEGSCVLILPENSLRERKRKGRHTITITRERDGETPRAMTSVSIPLCWELRVRQGSSLDSCVR